MANQINRKKVEKTAKARREYFAKQMNKISQDNAPATSIFEEQRQKNNVLEMYSKMSQSERDAFDKQVQYKKLRENYAAYLKYVYKDYIITNFHAALCNICEYVVKQIESGQKVKICISCPPQHGKSMTLTETLPSWFIGRNPDLRCIITAYNADVAEKFGNKNRQLVKQYGKEIFGIQISESQDNKTLWDIDKHQGGLLSTGILGGLTSNGGALVIVDDPFKNGEEANNPDIREKVYQTFADSVLTRARGKGNGVIVIHTRWHEDDLIGRLQKLGWVVINIPCVWESGEDKLLHRRVGQTLCPEMGFDSEWAEQMQKTLGSRKWSALYQGKPFLDNGNIIKRSDIRRYDEKSMPSNFEEYVLSCDLSFGGLQKSNDPYCMTLWGRNGGNHYLLKIYNRRANYKDTALTIKTICGEYPTLRKKIIEKKAYGGVALELLGQEIGGFIPYDPKNLSKEDRLLNVVPYFEGGNVYFPDEKLEPKIEEFIEQLLRFPNATHDDFVDTISQYLLNYEYRYNGKISTDSKFSVISDALRGVKI